MDGGGLQIGVDLLVEPHQVAVAGEIVDALSERLVGHGDCAVYGTGKGPSGAKGKEKAEVPAEFSGRK